MDLAAPKAPSLEWLTCQDAGSDLIQLCSIFVQARVPKQAFDYTRFDDPLIAGLLVGKFADFLPNYRQEEILKRSGVRLSRSTMGA